MTGERCDRCAGKSFVVERAGVDWPTPCPKCHFLRMTPRQFAKVLGLDRGIIERAARQGWAALRPKSASKLLSRIERYAPELL